MDYLIYANTILAVTAFLACVWYVIKNDNAYRNLFIWKSVATGMVAILYLMIAFGYYKSYELIEAYRVAWFIQLWIPIVIVIALWGNGKSNGHN